MAKVAFEKPSAKGKSVKKTAAKPVKEETPTKEAPVAETEVVEEEEAQPQAAETTTAVAVPQSAGPVDFADDDDAGMDEINIPRMNLVQKVGPLSEEFIPGEIVLNKELIIYEVDRKKESEPLEITVLGFRPTQWTERVAGGALGRLFQTADQVVAAGGTTNYKQAEASIKAHEKDPENNQIIPYFQQLATALVLIKKPEGLDDAYFPYDFEDEQFAIAQWSMKGGAFTNGAKVLKTARRIGHLRRGGYPSYAWSLSTRSKAYEGNHSSIIPVLRPARKHSEAFVAFAKDILGTDENEQGNV